MPEIALLVETGATPSAVTATLDVFRIANRFEPDEPFHLTLFSCRGGPVVLSQGLSIESEKLPQHLQSFDAVILPGFFACDVPELIEMLHSQWRFVIDSLKRIGPSTLVAASCFGTFVLAESGLLNGRSATTTWWLERAFSDRYPQVQLHADQALVDDGSVLTAGAMSAHVDLSLQVLRRLKGHSIARSVGSIMLVNEARASQLPFVALQRCFGEPLIDRAIALMAQRLKEPFSAEALAAELHVSYRTLHRRFDTVIGSAPLRYLQALRVEQAKVLLETTRKGVEQIANDVGYSDPASFRRLFQRLTSLSPTQYRRQFQREGANLGYPAI